MKIPNRLGGRMPLFFRIQVLFLFLSFFNFFRLTSFAPLVILNSPFFWWCNPLHVRSVHIEGNIDQLDLEITLEISYPAKPKRPGWANTCGVKVEFAQYGIHEAKGIGSESRIHLNQP